MRLAYLVLLLCSFNGSVAASDTCERILQQSCGTGLQSCEKGEHSRKAQYDDCKARAKDSIGSDEQDPNLKSSRRVTDTKRQEQTVNPVQGLSPDQMYLRAQLESKQAALPPAHDSNTLPKPAQCEAAYKRWCNKQCNGDYGNFCFLGAVCDPGLHRCVKGTP